MDIKCNICGNKS
ncbi:hypothetical protein KZ447_00500, partial [Glaesserella parasuis]|nr:hypothetical protein [Glaesserella parasuis]MCT8635898.1 hypothetical protein [Glaesserella parasuis]